MAPSPENGSEPKAPDKQESTVIEGAQSVSSSQETDIPAEYSSTIPGQIADQQEDGAGLSGLDEGQLKALLDEAITYKRPKDREGKSNLFKELLLEAELIEAPPPGPRTRLRSERHQRPPVSERPTHGGSLQDLAESELFDPSFNFNPRENYHSRKTTGTKKKTVSVSARQREGGSLPSNVNTSSTYSYDRYFLDDIKHKLRETNLHADRFIKERERRSEEKLLRTERKSESDKRVEKPKIERDRKSESDRPKQEKNIFEAIIPDSDISSDYLSSPYIPKPDYLLDIKATSDECHALIEHDSLDDENRYESIDTRRNRFYEQEEGTELEIITPKIPRVNYTSRAELEVNMENSNRGTMYGRSQNHTAPDAALPFTLLDSNPLQLGSTYSSVNCIVGGDKINPELRTRQIAMLNIPASGNWLSASSSMATGLNRDEPKKSLDENGNAVQTFNSSLTSGHSLKGKRDKPKQKKSDRNVKVLKAEEVAGHRTETNIDLILQFIENIETPKKTGSVNKVSKSNFRGGEQTLGNKSDMDDKINKKRLDRKKENKDGSKNLQKSNSLEELSCSKLEDLTENTENDSVLRSKKKQTSSVSNDRRSWGEDICYLDTQTSQDSAFKKSKPSATLVSNLLDKIKPTSIISIEPSTTNSIEASDFHVVTKKKKTKKRLSPNLFSDENRMKSSMPRENYYNNKNKYSVANFSNDHDVLYLNKFNSPEHRRKSASSMPPSDKSDSSDLDSVHSLPVESTSMKLSLQQVSSSSGGTPQASYADIARMANVIPGCMSLVDKSQGEKCLSAGMHDKWPCVSKPPVLSISPPICSDFSGSSTCSSTLSSKSQCSVKMSLNNYNFPDLIESCHYYSEQAKKDELKQHNEIKKSNSVKNEKLENNKNKLSKSKSVENESVIISTEQCLVALSKTEFTNAKNTKSSNILSAVDNNNKKTKHNKTEIKLKATGRNTVIENDNNIVNDDNRTENNNKSKKQVKSQSNHMDRDRNIHEKPNNRYKKSAATTNNHHTDHKGYENTNQNDNAELQSAQTSEMKNNLLNKTSVNMDSNGVVIVSAKTNNSDQGLGFRPPVIILDDEVDNDINTPIDEEITFGFDLNEKLLSGDLSDTDSSGIFQDLIVLTSNSVKDNIDLIRASNPKDSVCLSSDNYGTVDSFTNSFIQKQKSSTDIIVNNLKEDNVVNANDSKTIATVVSHIDSNAKKNNVIDGTVIANEKINTGTITSDKISVSKPTNKLRDIKSASEEHDGAKEIIADIPLKFIPPKSTLKSDDKLNHDKIVHYVEIAWEDVIQCGDAQYFAGQ